LVQIILVVNEFSVYVKNLYFIYITLIFNCKEILRRIRINNRFGRFYTINLFVIQRCISYFADHIIIRIEYIIDHFKRNIIYLENLSVLDQIKSSYGCFFACALKFDFKRSFKEIYRGTGLYLIHTDSKTGIIR